jgi:hypothetical protein
MLKNDQYDLIVVLLIGVLSSIARFFIALAARDLTPTITGLLLLSLEGTVPDT